MITKKKKILIIVLIVLVILSIMVISFSLLYIQTDLFKTDEQLFYKYISKNAEVINLYDKEWFEKYNEKIKEVPYSNNGEISFKLESSNDTEKAKALNNLKINFQGKTDKQNKKQSQDIKLIYNNNNFFELNYIRTNDIYGIKSDEVVNKYLSIENNNLKEFAKKLGVEDISNIPDKLEIPNYEEILKLTDEEKKILKDRYIKLLQEQISEANFSKEKNESNNLYILTLTETQLNKLTVAFLETVKNDEIILNILSKGMKAKYKEKSEVSDIKENIQNTIDELNKQETEDREYLKIVVYEKDRKLEKTEVIIENTKILLEINNENSLTIEITNIEDGSSELKTEVSNALDNLSYKIDINKNNSENTAEMNVSAKINNEIKVSLVIKHNNLLEANSMEDNIILEVNASDTGTTKYDYMNKKQFDSNIKIEELNQENSAKINDFTKEDIENTLLAIGNQLEMVITKKMQEMQIPEDIFTPNIIGNAGKSQEDTLALSGKDYIVTAIEEWKVNNEANRNVVLLENNDAIIDFAGKLREELIKYDSNISMSATTKQLTIMLMENEYIVDLETLMVSIKK